jgi:hypothetical protein
MHLNLSTYQVVREVHRTSHAHYGWNRESEPGSLKAVINGRIMALHDDGASLGHAVR